MNKHRKKGHLTNKYNQIFKLITIIYYFNDFPFLD